MADRPTRPKVRLRLCFSKRGRARYLSHKDMIRVWERAFRRAELPLAYSTGFSPGPELRFGPPLPVGYEGYNELLDVDLEETVPPGPFLHSLAQVLPSGLVAHSAKFIPVTKANLMSSARAAVYKVWVTDPPVDLRTRISQFLEEDSIAIHVSRGPKIREIDVRGAVLDLAILCRDVVRMQLVLGHGASCRPDDVARLLDVVLMRKQRLHVIYKFPSN